jgi:hypothetical protein
MIEQLFGSKTRVKLLQLFYTNPNRSFYVREITRKVSEQINSVRRELANLLSIGIITSDANNNRLYYEVNQDYEHYESLAAIFGGAPATEEASGKTSSTKAKAKKKADAPEHPLAKQLRLTGKIDLALLTGQFTRDESSGVDILIVGDVNQAKISRFMTDLEKAENKELRYAVLPLDNFNYRLQINDRFINQVLEAKKQVIISNQDL